MKSYNLTDKTIIVTGANSGIGKQAAIQLAQAGGTVVMACRSLERGIRALEEIQEQSGSSKVQLMRVDMSSQQSIRHFVNQFKASFQRLDVLIHNAANFDLEIKQPVLNEDGIETVFATNHIGPFLMTNLLLNMLKSSAPGRIITVASKGLVAYPFLDIDFENLNGEKKFTVNRAYYQSKLAQVMFTFDLAERLQNTDVTVNCVRVGNVALPDERLPDLPGWMLKIYELKRSMALSPETMAETYTWLAADPELGEVTGKYWDAPDKPVKANRNAYSRETWKRLWDVSAKLAGI